MLLPMHTAHARGRQQLESPSAFHALTHMSHTLHDLEWETLAGSRMRLCRCCSALHDVSNLFFRVHHPSQALEDCFWGSLLNHKRTRNSWHRRWENLIVVDCTQKLYGNVPGNVHNLTPDLATNEPFTFTSLHILVKFQYNSHPCLFLVRVRLRSVRQSEVKHS